MPGDGAPAPGTGATGGGPTAESAMGQAIWGWWATGTTSGIEGCSSMWGPQPEMLVLLFDSGSIHLKTESDRQWGVGTHLTLSLRECQGLSPSSDIVGI
jgi:hypothetical protein